MYRTYNGNKTKINSTSITATTFVDSGIGVEKAAICYYTVTALKDTNESLHSNSVSSCFGTRVPATNPTGFSTTVALKPYIVEGTVSIGGGNVSVVADSSLYFFTGSTLIMGNASTFTIHGFVDTIACAGNPATITANVTNNPPTDNDGYTIFVAQGSSSVPILRHMQITNLRNGGAYGFKINRSVIIEQCKISGTLSTTYLDINAACQITNCSFTNLSLQIVKDLSSTTTSITNNIFRSGYYSVCSVSSPSAKISSGQISNNDFDGDRAIYTNLASVNLHLANNYWTNKTPTIDAPPSTITILPMLTTKPASLGPNW